MEQLLQVGVITQTHGVRGEVKVFPTTDDPARFKQLKQVVLDTCDVRYRERNTGFGSRECQIFQAVCNLEVQRL